MTSRRLRSRHLLPWLLILLALAFGPVLAACAPSTPAATPTPTKTPRPEMTGTPEATGETAPTAETPPTDAATDAADTPEPNATAAGEASAGGGSATAAPAKATPRPSKPAGSDPTAAMSSPDYGVQAFLWWREEVADRDLKLIQDAGFHWVKQLFSWQDIEGAGKGQYDWSKPDRILDQVEKYGLKLVVRLSEDPDRPFWAGSPPGNAGDFAEFVAAVASRYKGRIAAYQIWNEPNLAREWGKQRPDPAGYARMLKMCYTAIKAIDPDAIVISAGMAPTGTDTNEAMPDIKFYEQMYKAMGGDSDGYFDMLGAHAAGFAAAPEVSPDETAAKKVPYGGERFFAFRHVEDVRKVMEKNGDTDKRIAILEFGWTTDNRPDSPYYWHGAGAGIDEVTKGKHIAGAFEWARQNWQPWIGLMVLIYMPDVEWTKDTEQYYWSIIGPGYPDLFMRASYVVVCSYLNELAGKRCWNDPGP